MLPPFKKKVFYIKRERADQLKRHKAIKRWSEREMTCETETETERDRQTQTETDRQTQ